MISGNLRTIKETYLLVSEFVVNFRNLRSNIRRPQSERAQPNTAVSANSDVKRCAVP